MSNPYEAKQARRKARLESAADSADQRAEAADRAARRILDVIPLGQPILVGHHSERRHRRDLRRVDSAMSRQFAEYKRAKDLRRRADAVGTGGISSDDPEAVIKLRKQLTEAKETREIEKRLNVQLRAAAKRRGKELGRALTAEDHYDLVSTLDAPAALIKQLRSYARAFPWLPQFGNHTQANIKRIEERIKALEIRDATAPRAPIEGDGWTIEENRDVNRVQIRFDSKPDKARIAMLKSAGFRWSPSETAWQRQLNNSGWHAAMRVMGVERLPSLPEPEPETIESAPE